MRKLLDRDALAERVRGWRHAGKRVVLTNGFFDLLHAGHLALLHQAAQYGDVLIVAINSDASSRRLKGPQRPIVPAPERASLLAALECVDVVTVFDEETPPALLEALRPDVLVNGEDYPLDQIVGRELVESGGGVALRVPLLPGTPPPAWWPDPPPCTLRRDDTRRRTFPNFVPVGAWPPCGRHPIHPTKELPHETFTACHRDRRPVSHVRIRRFGAVGAAGEHKDSWRRARHRL